MRRRPQRRLSEFPRTGCKKLSPAGRLEYCQSKARLPALRLWNTRFSSSQPSRADALTRGHFEPGRSITLHQVALGALCDLPAFAANDWPAATPDRQTRRYFMKRDRSASAQDARMGISALEIASRESGIQRCSFVGPSRSTPCRWSPNKAFVARILKVCPEPRGLYARSHRV